MSHYGVVVITKTNPDESWNSEIDDILAPYSEHIKVPEYVSRTKQELIDSAKHKAETIRENLTNGKSTEEEWMKPYLKAKTDNDFYQCMVDTHQKYNENGDELSTYNPESRWDYWSEGRPWPEPMDDEDTVVTVGTFKKYFIDFNKMSDEDLKEKYKKDLRNYKKLLKDGDGWYNLEYLKRRYPTFRDYLKMRYLPWLVAIVDENGWYEAGKVGWFATIDATPEQEAAWVDEFFKRIFEYDDNLFASCIDCHI